MDYANEMNQVLKLAEIIGIKEQQNLIFEKRPFTSRINPSLGKAFIIRGIDNLIIYEKLARELYEDIDEIFTSVSKKVFYEYLNKKMFEWKLAEYEVKEIDIQNIFNAFLEQKNEEYLIIKGIYGIRLNDKLKKVILGPFDIFNIDLFKNELSNLTKINQEILWIGWEYEYLATIKVKARDTEKAKEIAYEKYYQLELFIYFAIGQYKEDFAIKIVSKIGYEFDNCIILSNGSITSPHSRKIIDYIPIDDTYFTDEHSANGRIWNLIKNQSLDKMKKKIASAIEWIGKANSEINEKNRFIFYLISLESVFTFQEKTLISPSIVSNLAECVAFILGKSKEERIEIDKVIKNLYEIRSALSHGFDKTIDKDELTLAGIYSKSVVTAFLIDEKIKDIDSPEKLSKYIKELKYR